MSNNSNLSKRAALRQQQEQDDRSKRNKRVAFAGIGLAAVVVLIVIGFVAVSAFSKAQGVTADQLTPPNATAKKGILMDGKKPSANVPHLVIWEDYQCPACKAREEAFGGITEKLVADGKITVEVRSAYFLDGKKLDQTRIEDGSSKRAAIAAAAADSVGMYRQYHDVVYQNQPTEGVGFTADQLRDQFAKEAGITGDDLTKFQKEYDERAYDQFVRDSQGEFDADGITGTPTYLVSGQKLEFATQTEVLIQPTEQDLLRAITEAWEKGGKKNDG